MHTRAFYSAIAARAILTVLLVPLFLLAPVDQPAYGAGRALLVGIENYPNPKMKLRGVQDDVELLKNALTDKGLFAPSELKVVLDQQATRANMIKGIQDWLINGTRPGDTIFFYYSGHGMQLWDDIGDSEDGHAQALVCWDAKVLAPKERRTFRGVQGESFNPRKTRNLLMDHEIHALLKKMTGRTVIFACDSCFCGTVYKTLDPFFVQNKTIDQPEGYESVFDKRVPEEVFLKAARRNIGVAGNPVIPGVNLAALLSSGDYEPSQVVRFTREPTGFHSVFTWFLYHGIRGAAADSQNGAVTFGSLAKFIHDGVKRAGFAQTPQHVFSPATLESQPLVNARTVPQPSVPAPPAAHPQAVRPTSTQRVEQPIARPNRLGCKVDVVGVSASEVERLKSELIRRVPQLFFADDPSQVSCRVALEKKGNRYGARLSDATGSSWETNEGTSLAAVVPGLAGNVRAYYLQSNLAALRNPSSRLQFDLNTKVKSQRPRAEGETVVGDFISFESMAKTPGYLYIFNVNSAGVINPLYPGPDGQSPRLTAGQQVALGPNDAFQVREPFGKEVIVALLLEKPSPALATLWAQNRIGDATGVSFQPQQLFLETLWNALSRSGKPQGEWTSAMRLINSFRQ